MVRYYNELTRLEMEQVDKDEKWTEIIGGMTIYKDIELKAYLEQAGFHDVQIHKKKSWLCITARK